MLQAKGSGIGPVFSALGQGLQKLPATILAVEKAKGKGKGFRTLTEAELKQYKLPSGTVEKELEKRNLNKERIDKTE